MKESFTIRKVSLGTWVAFTVTVIFGVLVYFSVQTMFSSEIQLAGKYRNQEGVYVRAYEIMGVVDANQFGSYIWDSATGEPITIFSTAQQRRLDNYAVGEEYNVFVTENYEMIDESMNYTLGDEVIYKRGRKVAEIVELTVPPIECATCAEYYSIVSENKETWVNALTALLCTALLVITGLGIAIWGLYVDIDSYRELKRLMDKAVDSHIEG